MLTLLIVTDRCDASISQGIILEVHMHTTHSCIHLFCCQSINKSSLNNSHESLDQHSEEIGKIQRELNTLEPLCLQEAKGEGLRVEYLKVSVFASGH